MFARVMATLVAAVAGVGVLGAKTLGAGAMAAKLGHNRFGFKPGESIFTPKYEGGRVLISSKSDSNLGKILSVLLRLAGMESYDGKVYVPTQSEGELLAAMAGPPHETLKFLIKISDEKDKHYAEGKDIRLEKEVIKATEMRLRTEVDPIQKYLRSFPEARTFRVTVKMKKE